MELNVNEELLSVNDKITASCPTDILRSQALNQSVTNNKYKLWKTVRLTSFQNPTISIRRNLLQVSPSVLIFIFAVLLIPSFNVLNGYFYVLLNLMHGGHFVRILIKLVTQPFLTMAYFCQMHVNVPYYRSILPLTFVADTVHKL